MMMRVSTRLYENDDISRLDSLRIMSISTRKSYQTSTRLYVWIPRNFRPLGWQTARLMVRSLSPQYLCTFHTDSLLTTYRILTDYQTE